VKSNYIIRILVTIVIGSVFFLLPDVSFARWAAFDDATAVVEFKNYDIHVRKDGTHTVTGEWQVSIIRESARSTYGLVQLQYNTKTSKITVDEAKTINGDTILKVAQDLIEDKPLASYESGFDTINQVSIAFPQVTIGSHLYMKTTETVGKVPVPDFYSERFYFGYGEYTQNTSISIESGIPLEVETNDPYSALTIETSKSDKGTYLITIKQTKPLFTMALAEDNVYLNMQDLTWVVVSSSKEYKDLASGVVNEYEQRFEEPMPPAFESIYESAKKYSSPIDRINTITSLLADTVRYLGDWRPVRGGYIPRHLETIADTRFGDCKDFSLVTSAILRKLGYESYVAWVHRGVLPLPIPRLPFDKAFNHAIVWVKADGKVFWIDPTNYASFARGIFPDILDRQALIIHPKTPRIETIPQGEPGESIETVKVNVMFDSDAKTIIDAQLALQGRSAITLTGIDKLVSREILKDFIAEIIAPQKQIISTNIEPVKLESRIVPDSVGLKAQVTVKHIAVKTTAGSAYLLDSYRLNPVMHLNSDTRGSDVFLGYPDISNFETRLQNARLVGNKHLDCTVDSKWLRASRSMKTDNNNIIISDTTEIKKKLIRNYDLKSEEFKELQRRLQTCFDNVAVIFEMRKQKIKNN